MRIICLFFAFYITLSLSACAISTNKTNPPQKSTQLSKNIHPKNPMTVALFTGTKKPVKPYIVLGKETVSKYNPVGIKRQEANIRDVMRHDAAKLGGDAVINISHDANSVTGTVIAFSEPINQTEKA